MAGSCIGQSFVFTRIPASASIGVLVMAGRGRRVLACSHQPDRFTLSASGEERTTLTCQAASASCGDKIQAGAPWVVTPVDLLSLLVGLDDVVVTEVTSGLGVLGPQSLPQSLPRFLASTPLLLGLLSDARHLQRFKYMGNCLRIWAPRNDDNSLHS